MLRPLDIPRDASGLFRPETTGDAALWQCIEREVAMGPNRLPRDVRIDLSRPEFWAYWIAKSRVPIERAYEGSGLESHFAAHLFNQFDCSFDGDAPPQEFLTLALAGDLMCTPGLANSAGRLYERVADLIFDADVRYANLESTLTTQPLESLTFRKDTAPSVNISRDEYAALVRHDVRTFNVLHLANNHVLDRGLEGIETTCRELEQQGITGIGVNWVESNPSGLSITEHSGARIGWVAHTFSVNFKPIPADHPNVVNFTPFHLEDDPDTSRIESQIRQCQELGCEFIVVGLHWGLEFEMYPHPDQLKWARRFAQAGADLVVGHHPHVVQPMEILELPGNPVRYVPVIYSLGNLTPVFSHPASAASMVVRVTLARDARRGNARRLRFRSLEATPVALLQEMQPAGPVLQLWRLRELLSQVNSHELATYAQEMARFIDMAVGTGWRQSGSR